jgi:hypothetical protein
MVALEQWTINYSANKNIVMEPEDTLLSSQKPTIMNLS